MINITRISGTPNMRSSTKEDPERVGTQQRATFSSPHERNDAIRAVNQLGSVVYAMRVEGDLIKIGFSAHLAQRRYALKGEMLGFMFGTLDDEQTIHASLTAHLHHGREWYYPTPGVLAVVNEMRQRVGLAPIAA